MKGENSTLLISQATTPTFILTVPDTIDLTTATNMVFSLVQEDVKVRKNFNSLVIDIHSVSVFLTQEDTMRLQEGDAVIQLNWTYLDGTRVCSKKVKVKIESNLLPEVI